MSETMEHQSSVWPDGIAAITLFVEDLEESKRFYQRAFGMPVTFEDPASAVFRFGDTLVNLLKVSAAPELIEPARVAARDAGSRSVFTIEVDDVDTVCADLQTRGVALLNGPIDRPWGPRTASFTDPSGNIWEIAH
jgi:catechol 2,3-dioxygenase-like lactoylglutathione lyase family enzyme